MFGILEAVTVPTEGVYSTLDDLMQELSNRTQREGYKVVKARSHRGRPGAPTMRVDLCCERGGRPYRCSATKHKTSTKKTDCPWKAKAVDRKMVGGWVLTIICDQHNHEPGTPEPATPSDATGADDELEDEDGPPPDAESQAALQVAGVSDAVLRLSGDTFHRFKNEYRKMSQPERMGILAQMQLRIAAIYAIQNEEVQRQRRQDAQEKRHQDVDGSRTRLEGEGGKHSNHRRGAPRVPHPGNPAVFPHGSVPYQEPRQGQEDAFTQQLAAHQQPEQQGGPHEYATLAHAPALAEMQFQPLAPATASGEKRTLPSYPLFPGPPKRLRGSRQSQGRRTNSQQHPRDSQRPNAPAGRQSSPPMALANPQQSPTAEPNP
ncbi:hypothetical protein RJ55_06370 [Drechmeria coniospora]|nr:hypothetical protein RJ55_06370 [Drechmeria coniospora]